MNISLKPRHVRTSGGGFVCVHERDSGREEGNCERAQGTEGTESSLKGVYVNFQLR